MSSYSQGMTLQANQLTGVSDYIIDTTKQNAWIKSISYDGNFINSASSTLSINLAVSNYSSLFSNYIAITSNNSVISSLNLSGRYVNLKFTFNRNSVSALVPKITDFNINFDYNELVYVNREIYKTKSDLFGIHYALLKDDLNLDIYNKKLQDGQIIVRTLNDKVEYLNSLIPNDYTKYQNYNNIYPNLYTQMLSNIKDFELFYDTLMVITTDYIVFEKLIFDYSTNELSTDPTNFYVINLSANNYTYGDIWFFEHNKEVLLFFAKSDYINSVKVHLPIVYNLNIPNQTFTNIEIVDETSQFNQLTSLSAQSIEIPVISYNDFNKIFNMTYIFQDQVSGLNIASYDMTYTGNKLYLDDINIITPVEYS